MDKQRPQIPVARLKSESSKKLAMHLREIWKGE
jgi:hypothetical protein